MNGEIVLRAEHIMKEVPGVKALDDVQLELRAGEVHALCGENGAGKSTLLKVITGIYAKDGGDIYVNGEKAEINTVSDARKYGIYVVSQEMMMAPSLTVAENIYMGNLPRTKTGYVDWKKMYAGAKEMQKKLGKHAEGIDVKQTVESLSMGHKQMIEIMRSMIDDNTRIIAFDEPTASLSAQEVEQLFRLIRDLKAKNYAIVYVSHKLDELFQICDTITVLKDGKYVDTKPMAGLVNDDIVRMMIGRDINLFGEKRSKEAMGKVALKVENFSSFRQFEDINFEVHHGEILGFYGLVGAGRTEVMRALFGLDPRDKGQVYIDGKPVSIHSPKQATELGIGFVTEDRRREGLMLEDTIRRNISMCNIKGILGKSGLISYKKEKEYAAEGIGRFSIKAASDQDYAGGLSGGNQQKVIIAKWVQADCNILIFDEPTRGIDVGAKAEVYAAMKELANNGCAVIMVSSELPETLGVSDRVIVMREGRITANLENNGLTEQDVIQYAVN